MIYNLGDRQPILPAEGDYFVADNATVIGTVALKYEASVWFNSVLRGDNDWITVGERSNIQDGAVLHTDPGYQLNIGRNVTVGHQAMLHGCEIGDNSLIGIQAVVLNGARIGRNCLIGAQALVPENAQIPDNSLVLGSPGRVKRVLTHDDAERLAKGAQVYVDNFRRYLKQLHLSRQGDSVI